MKEKEDPESTTNNQANWRETIRKIERRYTEVFIEGNFRLYPKLYVLNKLTYPLRPYNIANWSYTCLHNIEEKKCFCC